MNLGIIDESAFGHGLQKMTCIILMYGMKKVNEYGLQDDPNYCPIYMRVRISSTVHLW